MARGFYVITAVNVSDSIQRMDRAWSQSPTVLYGSILYWCTSLLHGNLNEIVQFVLLLPKTTIISTISSEKGKFAYWIIKLVFIILFVIYYWVEENRAIHDDAQYLNIPNQGLTSDTSSIYVKWRVVIRVPFFFTFIFKAYRGPWHGMLSFCM